MSEQLISTTEKINQNYLVECPLMLQKLIMEQLAQTDIDSMLVCCKGTRKMTLRFINDSFEDVQMLSKLNARFTANKLKTFSIQFQLLEHIQIQSDQHKLILLNEQILPNSNEIGNEEQLMTLFEGVQTDFARTVFSANHIFENNQEHAADTNVRIECEKLQEEVKRCIEDELDQTVFESSGRKFNVQKMNSNRVVAYGVSTCEGPLKGSYGYYELDPFSLEPSGFSVFYQAPAVKDFQKVFRITHTIPEQHRIQYEEPNLSLEGYEIEIMFFRNSNIGFFTCIRISDHIGAMPYNTEVIIDPNRKTKKNHFNLITHEQIGDNEWCSQTLLGNRANETSVKYIKEFNIPIIH